ncbi:hypothetical protein [Streptomyces coeruleorubidus]|uniref:hypothetical protein n=1 Tax=Streptomyces coeruleorubidus TaxID=116188 RepID=UPI00366643FD
MSNGSFSARGQEAPESVRGDAWPVVPLAVALLLLRWQGDQTWAYVTAAVIGGIGLLAALIGLTECVKAVRRGLAPGKVVWVVVVLLLASFGVVQQLIVA